MSKKGVIFEAGLLVTAVVIFIVFFVVLVPQAQTTKQLQLGEIQAAQLKTYVEGEKLLLYIDEAANLAAQQAIYELAQSSGNPNKENCEPYFDNIVLNGKTQDCFVSDPVQQLYPLANKHLSNFLANYPYTRLPSAYNLIITNVGAQLQFIGAAQLPISLPIMLNPKEGYDVDDGELDREFISSPTNQRVKSTIPGVPVDINACVPKNGRRRPTGTTVDRVVLHHTGGNSLNNACNAINDAGLSIHYIIDRDGTIVYSLDESLRAAHAGCCISSCLPKCRDVQYEGMNDRSIGIEIVGLGNQHSPYTDYQYAKLSLLLNDIAQRYPQIRIDTTHVVPHYLITNGKWDPSENFEWDKIGLPKQKVLSDIGVTAPICYFAHPSSEEFKSAKRNKTC